jgi:hypothetical protein
MVAFNMQVGLFFFNLLPDSFCCYYSSFYNLINCFSFGGAGGDDRSVGKGVR